MLRQRVVTAVLLLTALLASIFLLPRLGWWVVCGVIGFVSGWEWAGFARFPAAIRWGFGFVVAVGVASLLALESQLVDATVFGVSALFWMVLVPPWLKQRWRLSAGPLFLVLGLVLILPAAVALARLRDIDPWLVLAVMGIVWVADIAAYFGGRAFGRHKLAPEISPGKSWEGAYAGMLGVIVYGVVLYNVWFSFVPERLGWTVSVLTLIALGVLSVVGDLFESLMKRHACLKDSSSLLPGHGGILDRIDSLTSTLPLAALWALLWQLTR